LVLADSYYENGDYQKCLDAVANYEKNSSKIFRKDYNYAKTLSKAIYSAKNVFNDKKYVNYADSTCKNILSNIDTDDWALRYFVATIYLDLCAVSGENRFLERAYSEIYKNVNYLIDTQKELNTEYLSEVKKKEIPDGATKRVRNEIKEYNKALEEERKVALPPISEPLYLNCELLFDLAEKLKVGDSEKNKITKMLNNSGENLFLNDVINSQFSFNKPFDASSENISFDGKTIEMPANIVSDSKLITAVVITENGKSKTIGDWQVKKVNRNKSNSPKDFTVILSSEEIKDCDFTASSKAKIILKSRDNNDFEYNFVAKSQKILFVDTIEFVKKK